LGPPIRGKDLRRLGAGKIYARRFVLDRARACEHDRGRPVNFIAVGYTTTGDAPGAVDELNYAL
jgi:hypothetical protein